MKIILAMHGKPKDKRILEIMDEYKTKIGRYQKFEFEFLTIPNPLARQGGGHVVQNILEKYSGKKIYLLDEDGKDFSSTKFAENYEKDLNSGEKEIVFVIGPAEGFGDISKTKNTHTQDSEMSSSSLEGQFYGRQKTFQNLQNSNNVQIISLSKMAMQHDIAALVLTEQIYRAISIKNNLPYHKV